jgi:hypothetical protein
VTPDTAKTTLDTWFGDHHVESVHRIYVENPAKDPYARYKVIHETILEPTSLEMARVEVWFTDSDEIAIGFETIERVAKRLSVSSSKSGFAAGHEPQRVSREGLLVMLDIVAAGEIALHATILPLVGVSGITAYTSSDALARLANVGYDVTQWLHARKQHGKSISLLEYRAWT